MAARMLYSIAIRDAIVICFDANPIRNESFHNDNTKIISSVIGKISGTNFDSDRPYGKICFNSISK